MIKVGDQVKFKKSDNSWENGIVVKIHHSPYVTVQWVQNNKLIGLKKVHIVFVKTCFNPFRCFKNKYCLLSILSLLGVIVILFDSYVYLKKVSR
jgi:hypothetical protein